MSFKKLKMAGFAHWILPVAAIVVVGGIGAYVLTSSKAASSLVLSTSSVNILLCRFPATTNAGSTNIGVDAYNKSGTVIKQIRVVHQSIGHNISYISPHKFGRARFNIHPYYSLNFYQQQTSGSPFVKIGSKTLGSQAAYNALPMCTSTL